MHCLSDFYYIYAVYYKSDRYEQSHCIGLCRIHFGR